MIQVFSTFTGIWWFELWLQNAIGAENFNLVGFSEIDQFAVQTFTKNFGEHHNFGDISKIDIANLPNFDLLTWGFPCQDVSVAGKQELSNGRTVLVEYLLRMLEEKQPKYFVFENVKGILQSKFEPFLNSILTRMQDAGYVVNWKLLNTKEQWLPQNRERVYFVGLHKQKNGIGTDETTWAPIFYTEQQYQWFHHGIFPKPQELKIKLGDILEENVGEEYFLSNKEMCLVKWFGAKYSFGWSVLNSDIYTTITRSYNKTSWNSSKIQCNWWYRILTPIECERLQGFPDGWTDWVKKSSRYNQLWNAVSVVVAQWVLTGLLKWYRKTDALDI